MPEPLIILGASVRSAARAAVAAGYQPWCVDLRGDRDLREMPGVAQTQVRAADRFPMGMLRMIEDGPRSAAVLLTGPLENHGEFVRAVAFERTLLGSRPEAIAAVRDPLLLPSLKPVKGLKFCETKTRASFVHRLSTMVFGVWGRKKYLLKPRDSWRGVGIEWWTPSARISIDHYVQQYIRGTSYTALFHADGWSCALLGVVEQIVGDAALGGEGFDVCGHVGPVKLSEQARAALSHLGVQLTQRCDVRGLFSVDLVMDMSGTLWPIEVNPRYPLAAEIVDRAEGAATLTGTRPNRPGAESATVGMASVLARRQVTMPDLYATLTRDQIADVPPIGQIIEPRQMICTVIAHGRSGAEVTARLRELAAKVYAAVETGQAASGTAPNLRWRRA